MHDNSKKEEFDYYLRQKASVAQFMDLIEEKNYTEAYHLAKQYPHLKDTMAYAQLEKLWEKSFELAKKLLAQDAQLNIQKVKELLKPFANVQAKKEVISTLLIFLNSSNSFLNSSTTASIIPSLFFEFNVIKKS